MEENRKIKPWETAVLAALVLLLCLGIAAALIFGGEEQANPEPRSSDYFDYFNTYSSFTDYSGLDDASFDKAAAIVEEKLDFYHRLFDIYHLYDGVVNLKSLNDLAGEGRLEISRELFDFLEYSKEVCYLTEGEVNIAMGAVLSIWHECRELGLRIPDMQTLQAAAAHTDVELLVLDEESLTAEITDPEASLDVGAVAKGYAVERIAEALVREGYGSFVLDVGGNLCAVGTKPNGDPWRTGVKNPDKEAENDYSYTFELSDCSAVTSGYYERYYIVDGVSYHHIIDKDTLMPAAYFASVTVVTPDSAKADALSTALFNMSYEEGRALAEREEVFVIWVGLDGSVKINE